MRDLNSRPSRCKRAALPTELIAHDVFDTVVIYYRFFKYYQYLAKMVILIHIYMMEIQCTITGKVQQVGFRDFVQGAAAELNLVGLVKNNPDGSVFVLAQGEPELLREFVEYLHEGSLLSKVEGIGVEWRTAVHPHEDFSIVAS